MDKWERLKSYIQADKASCEKLAEKAEDKKRIKEKEKWRCCALTNQYILQYMENLENTEKE
jgi:hypothetical protein